MFDYEQGENEISALLNQYFANAGIADKCEACPLPETPEEVDSWKSKIRLGLIGVTYDDSTYDPDRGNDAALLDERVRFRLVFQSARFRGVNGLWKLFKYSKEALTGVRLTNTDRLVPVKAGKYEVEQNMFQYYLDFECRTLVMQKEFKEPEPITGPFKAVVTWEQFNKG